MVDISCTYSENYTNDDSSDLNNDPIDDDDPRDNEPEPVIIIDEDYDES